MINMNSVLPNQDMITITRKRYEALLDDEFKLNCLENGGVDNWDWYEESIRPWRIERGDIEPDEDEFDE